MSKSRIQNVAASVRERLLNNARTTNRPFNELLQYYAMERFLYRLGKSSHAEKFVLKGALMFRMWQAPLSRPTMDIDLLGKTSNTLDAMAVIMKDLCHLDVEPDGVIFDADSVQAERITEDADYEGVRVKLRGQLDNARLVIQVDIGFSDVVVPSPKKMENPTKKTQWQVFIRKNRLDNAPQELKVVISVLAVFLIPLTHNLASGHAFSKTWKARGPWI